MLSQYEHFGILFFLLKLVSAIFPLCLLFAGFAVGMESD